MIVTKLMEVFSNCQFIISTHSPHILTHVQPESLFFLKQTDEGIIAENPKESYGKNVDRVLEDLVGLPTTRPDQVAEDLHKVFLAIQSGKLKKARRRIESLKQKIGDEPEELLAWKAQANENWQPTYADLRGVEKTTVKNCLMAEQGYICCYRERRLQNSDSHIEHLQPQSDLPLIHWIMATCFVPVRIR